jgi:hypothetical protein
MNRALRILSGLAVFLLTTFSGLAVFGAVRYDHRMRLIATSNVVFIVGLCSIVIALSFAGVYLLIRDGLRSK